MSIALQTDWYEPVDYSKSDDISAAIRMTDFTLGWFANPIFSQDGDYPQVMKDLVSGDRLPAFTQDEIDLMKGFWVFVLVLWSI